jgi:glycerophosphoryl diester phosphodiesterase
LPWPRPGAWRPGRTVGIYPEIKHSTFHAGGFGANTFENKLVSTLHAAYGNAATAPVFIQSFETANLQYLNGQTDIKLVQLVDADDVHPNGAMSLVAPFDRPYDFAASGDTRTFADLLTARAWPSSRPMPTASAPGSPTW